MKIHTSRDVYECASAEQYLDGVHLLNEDGSIYVIIEQPYRIQKVEGGEIVVIEQPEPAPTPVTWEDLDLAYTQGVDSI